MLTQQERRKIQDIEDKLDFLIKLVSYFSRRERYRDEERDKAMAKFEDEILAKLEAANTRQDGFLVLLQALKDNAANPAKLQQIARSIDEQQSDWEAAFAVNAPQEEPAPTA